MLVLLIALAVVISLFAEIACGLMQDRYGMRWVRPDVGEHHAIMRQLGRMR